MPRRAQAPRAPNPFCIHMDLAGLPQAERRRQKISVVNILNAIFIVYEYYRMTFMYLAKYSTVPSVFVRTACT